MLEAVEEEREWRGEGATGESAAEDGCEVATPRSESEEERGGCSGGRLQARRAMTEEGGFTHNTSSRLDDRSLAKGSSSSMLLLLFS